jgi:hypothetical protein
VNADKVPYYRNVVSDPMDFSTMISKCHAGAYLPSPIQLMHIDFELICNNAILFNFRTSHIHLEAKKLKLFGNYAFSFFSPHLQLPANDYITPQLSIKSFQREFSEKIHLFYYDILFSEEAGNSCSTILQRGSKELYIELNSINEFYINAQPSSSEAALSLPEGDSSPICPPPAQSFSMESIIEEEREEEACRKKDEEILREKSLRVVLREMMGQHFMHPFLAFEPVPICFSNKNLIRAETCLICGSFDSEDDLWICGNCFEGYHYYCLYPKDIDVKKSKGMEEEIDWCCPRCNVCPKCGCKTNEGNLIACLDCKKSYHLRCVGEKNCGIYWKCENCFKCEICDTKQMFAKIDEPICYEVIDNYSKCYQCSVLEAFFHFCKFCKKVNNLNFKS